MYHFLALYPARPPLFHPCENLPKAMYNDCELHLSSLNTASGDYRHWSNTVLRNLVHCS
jgi:hypothetical protein